MSGRVRAFLESLNQPMYANAYALVANQALSAAIGLPYWAIAAHLYGKATVGTSYAVISALALISSVAQLGLGGGMARFVPRAGERTRQLIWVAYAVVIIASAVLAIGFVGLGGALDLHGLFGTGPTTFVLVTLAAVLWSVFRLQDQVLIGLRQAKWVLVENTIYNVSKLVLLWIGASVLADSGIVGSWFIPTPIVIVLVTWLIFGVYTRSDRLEQPAHDDPLTVREIASTSLSDHLGALVSEAASRLLPIMVVAVLGAVADAYFAQAWLIASTLGLAAGAITDSFTAHAAADRANIRRHSLDILRLLALIIIPGSVVLAIGAPWILLIFGKDYASEGAALLQLLCLTSPLIVFNTWYLAYARVMGEIKLIISVQIVGAVLLLGLSYLLVGAFGITGVGYAWVVSQIAVAIVGGIDARNVLFVSTPGNGGVPA